MNVAAITRLAATRRRARRDSAIDLVLGQQPGPDVGDADLDRQCRGRARVVAGQQQGRGAGHPTQHKYHDDVADTEQ
jgi:hypothetical protein